MLTFIVLVLLILLFAYVLYCDRKGTDAQDRIKGRVKGWWERQDATRRRPDPEWGIKPRCPDQEHQWKFQLRWIDEKKRLWEQVSICDKCKVILEDMTQGRE